MRLIIARSVVRAHSGPPKDYTEREARGIIAFSSEGRGSTAVICCWILKPKELDFKIWLQKRLDVAKSNFKPAKRLKFEEEKQQSDTEFSAKAGNGASGVCFDDAAP